MHHIDLIELESPLRVVHRLDSEYLVKSQGSKEGREKSVPGEYRITQRSPIGFCGNCFNIVHGGSNDDALYSMKVSLDSSLIMVGYTSSFGAGASDVYLLTINGDGDTLWTGTFGGTDIDVGLSVAPTSDGGYIVAGATRSFVVLNKLQTVVI